ncbi:MAG: B12-binding domain-containing protein [Promethearchaeota archaeon]
MENANIVQIDESLINHIIEAVETLDFFSMKESIKRAIKAGISSIDIIQKGILKGLEESGELGLILAAEAIEDAVLLLDETKYNDAANAKKYSGKIVVGTIEGDIHNLGKNVLVALMKSYGMDIIDLGVDVKPEVFFKYAKLPEVKVIGISYLLSSVEPAIKTVMNLLKKENLAHKVKVILGGAAASSEIAKETKADAYALDALTGVEIIDKWLSE